MLPLALLWTVLVVLLFHLSPQLIPDSRVRQELLGPGERSLLRTIARMDADYGAWEFRLRAAELPVRCM